MPGLPSVPLEAAQEAQMKVRRPDLDDADAACRSMAPAISGSDETFVEDLLSDAFLPRDGAP